MKKQNYIQKSQNIIIKKRKTWQTVVIFGMEPTGHYWFTLGEFLRDNDMKSMHVNSHHVKASKEPDDNNPNKNGREEPEDDSCINK